ncbi:LysR substrate-binding domain-containing protein [Roseobacter sp. HKCCA0434]|uniref:LysR substrate-binding domain-containing protein n=1 Tax=Roseobacter sp. HKCCA0434 TaxID=3079297 RepID=UPI0029057FC3|nr:LysR substrate-binding domain-containing protein [Roseobacter sp. HKCCA0434]
MSDPLPPLAALRAFEATARHLSFSAAGRELNVTHAAVAQQVRALEKRMQTVLVQRAGRGLALTAEGQELARDLTAGFATIREGVARIAERQASLPVRIALTPSLAVSWFMPRMAAFRTAHPDIELALHPSAELIDMRAGEHDLAIRYGNGDWPEAQVRPFIPTRTILCAAPELLAGATRDRPEDLLALPWLEEHDARDSRAWLRAVGLKPEDRRNVTQLPGYMMLAGLRAGQGIAATTRLFAQDDLDAGRLTVIWEDPDPDRGYWMLSRQGAEREAVRRTRHWLMREAAST